jgi:GDP-L-fucose synthase
MMELDAKIYIAGHTGLVGSAILRCLRKAGYQNLLTVTQANLDLTSQHTVNSFFSEHRPDYVFLAAARVGGIHANSKFPAEFIYENLAIETNVIHAAWKSSVKKLLFLGSSCIYPKLSPQPLKEEYLLTGYLEPSNEPYAIAKIAGIKLCQAYKNQYGFNAICVMPTNLYGPGDNFDLENSHVLPALIRKCHEAKLEGRDQVVIWGTGSPRREFLHVDDLADACVFLMKDYADPQIINVGVGMDMSIKELAALVCEITGFTGNLVFDSSRPDGTPRKLLDITRLQNMGWSARIPLAQGVRETYEWYVANISLPEKKIIQGGET